jgi:hypothetical protein
MKNRLYEMRCDPQLRTGMIQPSDYLMALRPRTAVIQLRSRIEQLEERLEQVQDILAAGAVPRSDVIDEARKHVREIELAQQYISCLREHDDFAPCHSLGGSDTYSGP